jgi:hypothetical protein
MASYPDKYWHCSVQLLGQRRHSVVNDLSFEELQTRIIQPWHRGVKFPVSGLVVPSRDQVEQIKITQTERPLQHFIDQKAARDRAARIADMATNRALLPIWDGTDYTHELLFSGLGTDAPEPEIGLILRLCERLPAAARILAKRQHGKAAFEITDEYDVQDLLHAMLRAYLKYSVHEEPLGKVGGVRSGRADVAIEELGTIIEVKFVHGPSDQQRIVDDYSNDLLIYTKWPHLKNFIYLVYNAGDLRDPEALDKLAGPQTISGIAFATYIVRA